MEAFKNSVDSRLTTMEEKLRNIDESMKEQTKIRRIQFAIEQHTAPSEFNSMSRDENRVILESLVI
jgi:hypothetical protein